jgi:phosphonate transport system substrate-binding protein
MGFLGAIFSLASTLLRADTGQAPAAAGTFKLGIAPHTSARVILEMYQPLRLHLEKSLGMPVEVVTAPDFTEFAKRMVGQEYDIAVTTGHQARLSQTDAGYAPLLTYQADFRAVALVADKGAVRAAKDLKGKPVLGLSPSSLVTLWGQRWMKQNGLADTPIRYVSASDSVAQLVLAGEASAAFTSLANYQKLSTDMQSQLRFLAISEPMVGRVYVLNKRRAASREKIEAALWSFADSADGRSYFEKNKLDGYRKLKPRELEAMDPFAADVRQVLKQGGKEIGK